MPTIHPAPAGLIAWTLDFYRGVALATLDPMPVLGFIDDNQEGYDDGALVITARDGMVITVSRDSLLRDYGLVSVGYTEPTYDEIEQARTRILGAA